MIESNNPVLTGTPVAKHEAHGVPVYVKREDLSCPHPGPAFSKIRGVEARMRNTDADVFGVMDTYHSKAGWAVAYIAHHLGKRAVVYWPRYKADPTLPPGEFPRQQQQIAYDLGADMVEMKAGRSAILYRQARKHMRENYERAHMFPNALQLEESVEETAREVELSWLNFPEGATQGTWFLPVSSGTLAAGVLRGLARNGAYPNIIIHLGFSRSAEALMKNLETKSGVDLAPFPEIKLVDEGFNYKDKVDYPAPFPANPYYDLKTWRWLDRNLATTSQDLPGTGFSEPLIFWNIGD